MEPIATYAEASGYQRQYWIDPDFTVRYTVEEFDSNEIIGQYPSQAEAEAGLAQHFMNLRNWVEPAVILSAAVKEQYQWLKQRKEDQEKRAALAKREEERKKNEQREADRQAMEVINRILAAESKNGHRRKIETLMQDNTVAMVNATVYHLFAVHKSESGLWAVTHVPSGLSAAKFLTKDLAQVFAILVWRYGEWYVTEPAALSAESKRWGEYLRLAVRDLRWSEILTKLQQYGVNLYDFANTLLLT